MPLDQIEAVAPVPQSAAPVDAPPSDREDARLSMHPPSDAALPDIPRRPDPREEADKIAQSHFDYGKAIGVGPVPVAALIDGAQRSPSTTGLPVISEGGEVLAGNDVVDAARMSGVQQIPAMVIKDLGAPYEVKQVENAAKKASGPLLHPAQTKSVVREALDQVDSRGMDAARQARVQGFEAHYHAALDAIRDQTRPVPPANASRPQPGGPPMRAPDGQLYIHAPHASGVYQRVVG